MLLHGPVLIAQGRQVQRDVPRLPGAAGREGVTSTICEHHAERDGHEPHLVVLGDSVADGVGVEHHRDSIAGRLASRMSDRLERPVSWHVLARSGADARDVAHLTQPASAQAQLARADVVVISVGVNDVKNLRTEEAWRVSLTKLLTRVTALAGDSPVILLGLPPIEALPAMPQQLGDALGGRARRFEAIAAAIVADYPTVRHVPLTSPKWARDKAFADDGFHPSPWLHKKLAKEIDALLA
ncbi:SGNH/GDSL hydrolase family protein [Dermacoccus sp. UBA1591]|uniref:SGNH/GDSL hydrolase family protein n=1 Tax=Dermacoccus sp. UBA1591 TaxID=1946405 RepID=UPI00257A10B7|nr:SGNH/GDSL hydrolase family protein [Dermacoccus sp. UBA1591]